MMKIRCKQWPLYLSLVISVSLGILTIHIFNKLPNKNNNDWIGIAGAMLSLLGILLTIKSGINLETYYRSVKYMKIDTILKGIQDTMKDTTGEALELINLIYNSRGLTKPDLDNIKQQIDDYCNKLTNLLINEAELYRKEYDDFLLHGKKEKVTTVLSKWNSGIDSNCIETLQYIHENLPTTINRIREKNRDKIDNSLLGALPI